MLQTFHHQTICKLIKYTNNLFCKSSFVVIFILIFLYSKSIYGVEAEFLDQYRYEEQWDSADSAESEESEEDDPFSY